MASDPILLHQTVNLRQSHRCCFVYECIIRRLSCANSGRLQLTYKLPLSVFKAGIVRHEKQAYLTPRFVER